MKKLLLLLVIGVAFTSCQKEDDILQPIPQNPTKGNKKPTKL